MDITKAHIVKHELPQGAVILTKNEAITEQLSLILDWKPQSEVWPVVHGRGIMGITASLVGLYVNNRFRARLNLRSIYKMPTTLTLIGAPALLTGFFHTQIIFDKMLLLERTCPLCLEFKGALIQSFFGLVIPMISTPLVNFGMIGSAAHNIPHAFEFRKIFTVVTSVYKPMIPSLTLLFVFQALFGGYMTHLQINSYLRILNVHYLIGEERMTKRMHIQE